MAMRDVQASKHKETFLNLKRCGLDEISNSATFQSVSKAYLLMLYIVYILLALFYYI